MAGLRRIGRLSLNEVIKLWAHRRIHILCVAGLGAVLSIAGILGAGHSGSWRDSVHGQISSLQAAEIQMKQASQGSPLPAGLTAALDQQIAVEQLLLSEGVAPINWFPVSSAGEAVFQVGFPFYLLLFGWLAAEMLAQERAERTMGVLLSRPVARHELVLAKAVSLAAVSIAILVSGVLVAYVLDGIAVGGWDSFGTKVLLFVDPSKPALGGNVLLLPAWAYLLASLGLSTLAVLVAESLGLLVSALARGAGVAILFTLGALLVLPSAAVGASFALHLSWMKYLFFANLQPASLLTDRPTPFTTGSGPLLTAFVLAAWAIAFYGASMAAFSRRDEVA